MNMTSEQATSSLSSGDHESTTLCSASEVSQLLIYNVIDRVDQVRQDPPQFKNHSHHPQLETTLGPRFDNSVTILDPD
jgi:hypothetical protein